MAKRFIENKYRIKEIPFNKDGTNVWFYPQEIEIYKITTGFWWFKKEKLVEEINVFIETEEDLKTMSQKDFEEKFWRGANKATAFKTKQEAEAHISLYRELWRKKGKEHLESSYNRAGAQQITEGTKFHDIK